MRKINFIVIFIITHFLFIFLQIYKQNQLVELRYEKQRNYKIKEALFEKKQTLIHQRALLKQHETIKEYASNALGMEKVKLSQIHRMPPP